MTDVTTAGSRSLSGTGEAHSAPAKRARKRPGGRKLALYVALGILTILFISPLLYMTSTAFKTRPDAESIVPQWIPKTFTLDAWRTVLNDDANPVARWFFNSIMAATLQAILIVAVCSLAAYPLARMDFRGKKALFALIIATLFIPPIIMLIPNWVVVSELKWLDNLIAIIVPTAASAFGVFFLRQFFISLPRELEEAAYLDGANRWQIFWKVIVPLSKPALATLALLSFLSNWNDFLWPVYVLFSGEKQTLQSGLATLQSANSVRYDLLMTGALLASVPVLLLYLLAQRFIIEGVSRSGLKG
jgi:multiple sugar transport system permease protein